MRIIIIGGGAAGFFAAIRAAECRPDAHITILERGKEVLAKVKVSGGGRCNLTHACFVPRELVKYYPRGEKELLGPFHQFAPGDTIDWFERRGVPTKIEADGRMFPRSDDSQTVVDCLWRSAIQAGVKIKTGLRVEQLIPPTLPGEPWQLRTPQGLFPADRVLVATGASPAVWSGLANLGLRIVPPVPSLFTFNIKDPRLQDLLGVAVDPVAVRVEGEKLQAAGPLLITHWGLSGPAILRLSAWGARQLAERQHRFALRVNWVDSTLEAVKAELQATKVAAARRKPLAHPEYQLPARLWQRLLLAAGIQPEQRWGDLNKGQLQALANELSCGQFQVNGKSTFKEEFVTAGGVALAEINFKTFESRRFPGLYFAGEVLDIDAITGGFNFQAAWTGGWIAGAAMVQ